MVTEALWEEIIALLLHATILLLTSSDLLHIEICLSACIKVLRFKNGDLHSKLSLAMYPTESKGLGPGI